MPLASALVGGSAQSKKPRARSRYSRSCTPTQMRNRNSQIADESSSFACSDTEASPSNDSADYDEWPFQGLFKRTKIGEDVSYSLEVSLGHLY